MTGTNSNMPELATERCKLHTMELVDMYCVEHDTVGCHICFTVDHKHCQAVFCIEGYIQQNPNALDATRENSDIKNKLSVLEEVQKKRLKAIEHANEARFHFVTEIRRLRSEVNKELDRLEDTSLAEVDEEHAKLTKSLQDELDQLQETTKELKKIKRGIESPETSPTQVFINMKLLGKINEDTEKQIGVPMTTGEENLTFSVNTELLKFLQSLQTLGKLRRHKFAKHELYKVVSMAKYNVKQDKEASCNLMSSCIVGNSDILLANFRDCSIRMIDSATHTLKKALELASKPHSVCTVSDTEAVVTLYDAIQFVSYTPDGSLLPTKLLTFDHDCRGVAILDRTCLAVSDISKIYFHTMNGKRLKAIGCRDAGEAIFSTINAMCSSDDGKMLHVADGDNGVITINADGNVVWKYSGPELKYACGVCTDGAGNVFVIGNGSNNVIQIGEDGNYVGEVVPASQGLHCPQSVSFDTKTSTLIVATSCSSDINVFLVR